MMRLLFSLILFLQLGVNLVQAEETTPTVAAAKETTQTEAQTPIVASVQPAQTEAEIPLKINEVKKSSGNSQSVFNALLGIGIIGTLATAGYIFLRKYAFKNTKNPHTQIKILTQHYLGPKKSLAIIRVAGESVLIGITEHNISMIKSLALLDEDIPEEVPQEDFDKVFKKSNKRNLTIQEDEFSLAGIKDMVNVKLKNMRSLE